MASCKKCKQPLTSGIVLHSECYEKMEAELERLKAEVETLKAGIMALKAIYEEEQEQ